VELKAGETADAVVVIGGSIKIRGKVTDAVVAIAGDVDVEGGEVGDATVAVLGNVRAGQGSQIHGDAVAVGGIVQAAEGATIDGERVGLGVTGLHPEWLRKWFVQCVLKMRPLAPQVGWVWAVAGVFFLLYVLIAALFPRPVQACVEELTRRPATTFLMGLLTKLLAPVVFLILTVTGIGLLVVPFVVAALFLGAVVGKIAILEWLGFRIGGQFNGKAFHNPIMALVTGAVIVTVLYVVPVLGLLTFGIISVWGLGGAVMAAFSGFRKEQPPKPTTPPSATEMPAAGGAGINPDARGEGGPMPGAPTEAVATSTITASLPAGGSDVLLYPKASFWERMAAALLDVVLVGILGGIVGGPPLAFLVALAYFAGFWSWKGTTVGGIIVGLKVVRLDGQPLTFTVALVRGLAAAFSIIVLFLGFLWIAWDKDKQGWHDRIAGTIVLRLPRGMPLVCF
jgi:uncharacterized RDD family membrane protein YckC